MTRMYPARLIRVIDGDTVLLDVDLGFHVRAQITFRLARINCPERGTSGADQATQFTTDWCKDRELTARTSKGDPYGRWIADLYRGNALASLECLSDCLLNAGLAERYPKPKEKP